MPTSDDTRHIVVADAGPLIALGRIDLIHLLPRLFARIDVTETVVSECLARPDLPDAANISAALEAGWLHRQPDPPAVVPPGLDAGEASAIAYALAFATGVLMDDRVAVIHARARGLKVIGTLGALLLAKQRSHVAALAPVIALLAAGGHHLSRQTIDTVLSLAGETREDEA